MKKYLKILFCSIIILCLGIMTISCTSNEEEIDYASIEKIIVDPSITANDFDGFALSTFNIEQIQLIITYKSTVDEYGNEIPGEEKIINAKYSMIKAEDKAKLSTSGTKNITLIYGKFEINFNLKLYDDTTMKYKVYFYDRDGVTLLCPIQYVTEGGRATQPALNNYPGYTFVGWKDLDTGKNTTFDNITKDLKLKADYVQDTITVGYYYEKDKEDILIENKTLPRDANPKDYYPAVPDIEGYEFDVWVKENSTKYVATYSILKYNINFVYRDYSEGKYSDTFKTSVVKYDADKRIIDKIKINECEGISQSNDYHFLYWYIQRGDLRIPVTFPYDIGNMRETTFYAYYVDIYKGTDGLIYKSSGNTCEITSYVGEEDVVIIPEFATISGQRVPVVGIGEGAFKNSNVREFVVSSGNKYFSVSNGVLYNKSKTVLEAYPSIRTESTYKIENSVIEINPYAFYNAKFLVSVEMGTNLTTIKDYAFSECVSLDTVVIPEKVEEILEGAFKVTTNSSLNSISFKGTEIKSIGDEAFYGLNSLGVIEIPASLTFIGDGVFYGCSSLNEINTEKSNNFNSYYGALYDASFNKLYAYPALYYLNDNPEIEVHANCKEILRGAFYHSNISCITFNSNLSMQTYSIICPGLNAIRINSNDFTVSETELVQAFGEFIPETIYVAAENEVFALNTLANSIELVKYDTWQGYADYDNGFSYVIKDGEATITGYRGYALKLTIPNMISGTPVTKIANNAFYMNKTLSEVKMPIRLKEIGSRAFYQCKNLKTVILSDSLICELESIGDYAFYGCELLTDVKYNDDLMLKDFGKYVFEGTPILERDDEFIVIAGVLVSYTGTKSSVTISNNIVYIATDAFKDKGFITSINFESISTLKTIDNYAFLNCIGLTSIELPISVNRVEDYAFYGCKYLYYVKYSGTENMVDIGADAYYQAGTYYEDNKVYVQFQDSVIYKLTYSVNGENHETSGIAFVEKLEPELSSNELFGGWYYDDQFINMAVFPLNINKDVKLYAKILESNYASSGLEYELTEDGQYKVKEYNGEDTFVVVPILYKDESVVEIGSNAFGETVVEVKLPNYMDSNGNYQSYIVEMGIDAFTKSEWYKNIAGDFVIYDNILIGYKGNSKIVIIPEEVSFIAEGAFMGNTNIEYVKLPSNVNYVSANLFNGCTSLKEVVLSSSIVEIKEKAFYGCSNLEKINFDYSKGLNIISRDSLDGTAWLAKQDEDCIIINNILYKYQGREKVLHIPIGVRSIAEYAFVDNIYINTIYLPSSLEIIRDSAFCGAISLNSVKMFNVDNSLAYIMDNAFYGCIQLKEIDLGYAKKLAEINSYAFSNCNALKDVCLPSSLILLGEGAFSKSSIETVTFEANSKLQEISSYAFSECSTLHTIKFNGASDLRIIGAYAFYECVGLTTFSNEKGAIQEIKEYGFYNCRSLINVKIQESALEKIGLNAVYNLGSVSNINDNMIILGNILVSYIGTEKEVIIPANITLIYDEAFSGNTNIRIITFASDNKLESINDKAFYGCSNLNSINFPSTLENVGYQVFDGTAWYSNQLATVDYVIVNTTLIKYNVQEPQQAFIPEEVTTINKGAFSGMSVYDILIRENIKTIKDGAFDGILPVSWIEGEEEKTGWTLTVNSANPANLEYTEAFENCIAIYIQDEETLATYKLDHNWAIQAEGTTMVNIDKYKITYDIVKNEGEEIEEETIHALYSEKEVITLVDSNKQYVFVGWFKKLTDGIYSEALTYPFILKEETTIYAKCVDYDEGSNPQDYLLENCEDNENLYTIKAYNDETDKKVVIITEQANKEIYSITGYLGYMEYSGDLFTKYVYDMENKVFEEYNEYEIYPEGTKTYKKNTNIEEISFANNCTIEYLGDNSFAGMVNLTKITLPASVKYISANAFADCVNLTEIVFSDGMSQVEIATGAFRNCIKLNKITIPDSIKTLSNDAFVGCENLTEIYLEALTPIELYGALPFEFIEGMKIYIPYQTYNKYSATWDAYEDYIEELPENKEEETENKEETEQ